MWNWNLRRASLKRQARIFDVLATFAVAVDACLALVPRSYLWRRPCGKAGKWLKRCSTSQCRQSFQHPHCSMSAALARARHVFRRIGGGDLFARENSRGLTAIGRALLIGAVWAMAAQGLVPINPQDQLSPIGLGAADLALAALGMALMMIGRVMSAAIDLKAENDSFV